MNARKEGLRLMEWIVAIIIGILGILISSVIFYTAKISQSKYIIITIPFFITFFIIFVGGLTALIYNIVTKKAPNKIIVMGVVLETIGISFLMNFLLLYALEKSLGLLFPVAISMIFVVEGIMLPKQFLKDKYQQEAILHKKQLYGYTGLVATRWWSAYVSILMGISMFIYNSEIIFKVIGVGLIIFGMYIYLKKAIFYINFYKRKK